MKKQGSDEKFQKLAENRVRRAIKDIQLIGNLSNRNSYSYTEDEVKKIHAAIRKALVDMKLRFESKGAGSDDLFSF